MPEKLQLVDADTLLSTPMEKTLFIVGHSDFSTTANIYAHLDYSSKLSSAQAMVGGMPLPDAGGFKSKWSEMADAKSEE